MGKTKTGILFLFMLLAVAGLAHAMRVSPAVVEMYVPRGGEYEGTFEVTNTAAEPVVVTARFEDGSEWDRILEDPDAGPGGFREWLVISRSELKLGAGEKDEVSYKVKVPETGVRGELKGHVFFEQRASEDPTSTFTLVARIGNAVYCIIRGTEKIQGEVSSFSFREDPQSFAVGVKNTGNVHIRPKGDIRIWRLSNESTVSTSVVLLPVNERGQPLMFGEEMRFAVPCYVPLVPGPYRAIVELEFGNPIVKLADELEFMVL